MSDQVTLFHWEPNANSGKPMLALAEKGVKFDSHYIDMLNFDQHKPEYLAVNPQGTIPAMLHGKQVLTESTAIMEYVDATFDGPSLMPDDPRDRWRIRWWMKFMDQWLGPSFSMTLEFLRRPVGPPARPKELEALRAHPRPNGAPPAQGDLQPLSEAEIAESQRRIGIGITCPRRRCRSANGASTAIRWPT
jgi:glutathione S-transferase/GST-like protein